MRVRRSILTAIVLLCASPGVAAAGQGKVGLIATGSCGDPDLAANAQLLGQQLSAKLGHRLVKGEAIRAQYSLQPGQSAQEIGLQVATAKALLYRVQFTEATKLLQRSFDQIARLPPGQERSTLKIQVELLRGLALRGAERLNESDEAFRRILRLAPSAQLDPDYSTPSTRQRFETLRREVADAGKQRVTLEVQSNPPGAEVHLDGLPVGTTPEPISIHPGTYQLFLVKDGRRSFPRSIEVRARTSIFVDLDLEGRVDLSDVPCLAIQADERARFKGALGLATLLGFEEVVVLRLDRAPVGTSWLAASILDVRAGQAIREGGMKVYQLAPAEGIAELATYLLTGQTSPRMASEQQRHPAALYMTAGGAAAGIAGVVFLLVGNDTLGSANAFYAQGHRPTPEEVPRIRSILDAGRVQQGVGAGLLALGAAALLGGAALQFAVPSWAPSTVQVSAAPPVATLKIVW